jgi:Uma2 family endonuclease
MGMPNASPVWTAAAVRALPDDGRRYELVDGTLVVTPSPARIHQRVAAAFFRRVDPFLVATGIGDMLWSPADLAFGEDEILQPDLFVTPPDAQAPIRSWTDVTRLLLAIEIVSPSSARYDRQLKRRRYQRAGTPEYWIVDPDARLVERWRPEDTRPEILADTLTWQPDPGQLALEIDLASMFREAWGEPPETASEGSSVPGMR